MAAADASINFSLPGGLIHRNRKLSLDQQTLTYEAKAVSGWQTRSLPLADIAGVRYGARHIVLYRFHVGDRYVIQLQDREGQEISFRFSAYLWWIEDYWEVYAGIVELLGPPVIDRISEELWQRWKSGETVVAGKVEVKAAGVYISREVLLLTQTDLITWDDLYLKESYDYFSINSRTDITLYTNINYLKVWNGASLFSLLHKILQEKGFL
jgi:hypothetical protein